MDVGIVAVHIFKYNSTYQVAICFSAHRVVIMPGRTIGHMLGYPLANSIFFIEY
jgi:hypothetical protein